MPELPTLLRLNAASCLIFGALFVAVPLATAQYLGSPPAWLIRVLGIVLLVNGAHLIFASCREVIRRLEVLYFVAGDATWVAISFVLIATGTFITTTGGMAAALLVAIFVGAIGCLQFRSLRQTTA